MEVAQGAEVTNQSEWSCSHKASAATVFVLETPQ
jgi:hypothetical protein